MTENIHIRDRRKSRYFWADKEVLSSKISPTEKLVYFCLCAYADENSQQCYPAFNTIAERTGTSRSTVIRCLEKLESYKFIHIEKNAGRSNTNVYTLLELKGSKLTPVSKNDLKGVKYPPQKVSPVTPNLTKELTKKTVSSNLGGTWAAVKNVEPFIGNFSTAFKNRGGAQ